jgi:predicted site-specific integrase-resolvase
MDGEHLSIKDTRKLLGVTTETLRKWANSGKIGFSETPTGRKLYYKQDVYNIINRTQIQKPKEKSKIAYCRVSSQKQKDDLERQKDFFRLKYPKHDLVTDIGSGINWNRKGLQTILEQSMLGNVSEVVVAHRDRLCRFAFELIEFILSKNGVKLIVLNSDSTESTIDKELSDDILSIIHVYSCRQMGRRRYSKTDKNKKIENLSESVSEDETERVD